MSLIPKPSPPPNRVMFEGIDGAICCAISGYIPTGSCKICGSDLVKKLFGKEKCLRDECKFNGDKK